MAYMSMQLHRPIELYPVFAATTVLPGVGPRLAEIMGKRIGTQIIDLLQHLPVSFIDRSARPALSEIIDGAIASFEVTIIKTDIPPAHSKRPARIIAENDTGQIEIIYFRPKADYLKSLFPVGEKRLLSGRVELFQGRPQMAHPDYVLAMDKAGDMPQIEAVYPLTAGLKPKALRRAIQGALARVPALDDWIPEETRRKLGWPDFNTAIHAVHNPQSAADLLPEAPARARLAFDELLANQLALGLVRKREADIAPGRSVIGDEALQQKLLDSLPFTPTGAQLRVLQEIRADQASQQRMLRLVQGDVGSGKTLVALLAMLNVVETGGQAALLAPTEILARQHFQTISAMLTPLGLQPELLLGGARTKAKTKQQILDRLADKSCQLVIGTHALLNDDVAFADLRLAVVDEQHRFGVRQRLMLGQKSDACDVLVMTATPIPRTLSMTAYGDLNSSILDEKPAGRQPIDTAMVALDRVDAVIERLRHALAGGQRVYWICPLVEETDKLDISAAEDRHRHLSALLPEANPQMAHGKMKADARQEAMDRFKQGTAQLLVATTVIEVGVDVPEAGIMIIEHAERFGLAQLHQLRGRVGRGSEKASCILLYQGPLSETAAARLAIMRETNDGFRIAEEDLRLRGPGEVLGQRQSGMPEFVLANLANHGDLLAYARRMATEIVAADPQLTDTAHARLKTLLCLFEKDNAVRFLASG